MLPTLLLHLNTETLVVRTGPVISHISKEEKHRRQQQQQQQQQQWQ